MVRVKLSTRLAAASDRVTARVARTNADNRRHPEAVDLAVAAALAEFGIQGLNDPVGYVDFLRSCWQRDVVEVTAHASTDGDGDVRFTALLQHLAGGMAPLPVADAVRLARISDRLLSDRTPFDRPGYAIDVGAHASISSSFGHSGRLLTSVVRFMRSRECLEIGTAYGMSALFLASALERGQAPGTLSTIECSEPQATIAFDVLGKEHSSIRTFRGRSTEVLADVTAGGRAFDFLFHDGEHSGAAYVADFNAYEPQLAPGSVVLFDDITWEDPTASVSADTFAGWTTITHHPRVRQSAVLDGWYGLLLLR